MRTASSPLWCTASGRGTEKGGLNSGLWSRQINWCRFLNPNNATRWWRQIQIRFAERVWGQAPRKLFCSHGVYLPIHMLPDEPWQNNYIRDGGQAALYSGTALMTCLNPCWVQSPIFADQPDVQSNTPPYDASAVLLSLSLFMCYLVQIATATEV